MTLRTLVASLHESESGQDLIEYALVCALIALGAIAGMQQSPMRSTVRSDKVGSELNSATSANPAAAN